MGQYCKRDEIKVLISETIDMLKKDNEGLQNQVDHQFTELQALKKQDEEFDEFLIALKTETIERAEVL